MKLKILAGILALVGAVVAVVGLIYEPDYLISEASPVFPFWVKWVGLLLASIAIGLNLVSDIRETLRYKARLSK